MEKTKKPTFPKGFFTQPRPHLTIKEALKDSKPFDWGSETKKGNKRVVSKKING